MFITKKHLTRRTVLRGMGTAIALPLLDAMIPARTALAQTAAKPTLHLGFIYFPHGAVQAKWTPTGTGEMGEFGEILKAAGFGPPRLVPTTTATSILEALPA